MLGIYAVTIGTSAALLFALQPMFAKMVLPILGGSPAVWNTAAVFFQCTLLLAYLYAHALQTCLSMRRQALVHIALMSTALIVLPVHVTNSQLDESRLPLQALLAFFWAGAGPPFFALSATSPLLQSWLSRTVHPNANDPYFLYAASNAGSIVGLLAYPFVVEPILGLRTQSNWWSIGYIGLIFLMLAAVFSLGGCEGRAAPTMEEPGADEVAGRSITARDRVRWTLLALAPSSLMLGVTLHLSTVVAAIPMLWTLPLTLYLATFVLAFSRRPMISQGMVVRAVPYVTLPLVMLMTMHEAKLPLRRLIALHLGAFFVLSLACHLQLANSRPSAKNVTEFYVWLSVGGALGGIFNALLAPIIFPTVAEYPIALIVAVSLLPRALAGSTLRNRVADIAWPAVLGMVLFIATSVCSIHANAQRTEMLERVFFMLGTVSCLRCFGRPHRFALALAAVLGVAAIAPNLLGRTIHAERNFFGVKMVMIDSDRRFRLFVHGGTIHGMEWIEARKGLEPLTYYTREGPIGGVIAALRETKSMHAIGVVGLGIGTMACYARPGDTWTFYEIDPAVVALARDGGYFSYLRSCAPDSKVVLGDARLSLARGMGERFDLLVLDAYSSDQVPVHLITREALTVYRRNLAEHGVLAFHVSNQYFDLRRVLGNLAGDAALAAFVRDDPERLQGARLGVRGSTWIVMARSRSDLGSLLSDTRWHHLPPEPKLALWTDDYSSLILVLSAW